MRIYSFCLLICVGGGGGMVSSFTVPHSSTHHHKYKSITTAINYLDEKIDFLPSGDILPPPVDVLNQQQHQKQRQPIRRSFLHQLDRFLTELQGDRDTTHLFWEVHVKYNYLTFLFIYPHHKDTHEHLRNHTFLSGNFAPVRKEHVAVPVELVEGEIPTSLYGAFLRNGPNPLFEQQKKRYHWFDGHAMLHTLMLKDGEAQYTNQFIPSPRFSIERELGEEYFPQMGEYKGLVGLLKLMFHSQLVKEKIEDIKQVAPPNTNVLMYQKKLYALHEANLPLEIRMHPDFRLEYVGYETFNGVLDYPVSAHPVLDGDDLLFHAYSVDEELVQQHGTMKVGRYNSKIEAVDTYLVPTPTKSHVSFAHSLIHTEKYIIVWDCSVHFSTDALFMGGSFFKNNQDHTLKFGLIPKTNATSRDDVIWIDSGVAGAIVHPLHAWEEIEETEDGRSRTTIKLWAPFCEDLELDLKTSNTFHMMRYDIDSHSKTVSQKVVDDTISSEFATMPERPTCSSPKPVCKTKINNRDGTSNEFTSTLSVHDRYGFTAIFGEGGHFTGYAKWDIVNECLDSTVYYEKSEIGGEPMLVRANDGCLYVGSYVYNEVEESSYFLLFDGETNKQICRLKMPRRVPYGFHGQFIAGEDLESHFAYHEEKERKEAPKLQQCPVKWIHFFIRDLLGYPRCTYKSQSREDTE